MGSERGHTLNSANTSPSFSDHLGPSVGVVLFELLMTCSLGVAYARAYGFPVGVLIGVLATIAVGTANFATRTPIQVTSQSFRVGKAVLPIECIGDVTQLNENQTRESIRLRSHRSGYYVVKPWIRDSVVIEVIDSEDPHPFWLVSTRDAKQLCESLHAAKIEAGGNDEAKR